MNVWYGYVYKTINLLNGKVYIGQCKGEFDRSYHGSGVNIIKAIKLQGSRTFKTDVLSYCTTKEELDEMERHHIRVHRENMSIGMLYNIGDGGEGGWGYSGERNGFFGKKHTQENRKKMGRPVDNTLNPMHGKHHSEESKRKMSKNRKGRCTGINHWAFGKHMPDEVKRKISATKAAKFLSSKIGGK